jgi:hypothetical protein
MRELIMDESSCGLVGTSDESMAHSRQGGKMEKAPSPIANSGMMSFRQTAEQSRDELKLDLRANRL